MPVARLLLAVVLLVATAGPAGAHAGDDRGPSNHRTALRTPGPAPGLEARLVDAATRIELTWTGDGEVVVQGYDGEPYLRFDDEGVHENRRSPAAYLNATYDGGEVPSMADAEAEPEWALVEPGSRTARWHDHRFHPPPSGPPDEGRRQVVTEWAIPLEVDGEAVEVAGAIEWVPPPAAWPWWLLAALLAAAGVLAALRAGVPALLVVVALAVVADVVRAIGITGGVGGGVGTFVDAAWLGAIGWAAALVAAVLHARGRRLDAAIAAALAGAVVALSGGVLELGDVATSQLPSSLPGALARGVVAAALGLGGAAAVGGAAHLLRPPTR